MVAPNDSGVAANNERLRSRSGRRHDSGVVLVGATTPESFWSTTPESCGSAATTPESFVRWRFDSGVVLLALRLRSRSAARQRRHRPDREPLVAIPPVPVHAALVDAQQRRR